MTMREWVKVNNLEDVYNEYLDAVDRMEDELEQEGLPSCGSTYELRLEAIRKQYPELWPELSEC